LLINNHKIWIITQRLKQEFKKIYHEGLSQLILFASQAKGDAQPDSDIDILVVLKGEVNPVDEINRNSYFISELCLEFDALINCFYLSELQFQEVNKPLIQNVKKEGIILWIKKKINTVRFVTQVILSAPKSPILGTFTKFFPPQIWGDGGLTEQYWERDNLITKAEQSLKVIIVDRKINLKKFFLPFY